MEYRVLGPLEVLSDGRPLPLGGPKQRAVLAILVLEANEVVSADRLIAGVWGEPLPTARWPRSRCTCRGCASRSSRSRASTG